MPAVERVNTAFTFDQKLCTMVILSGIITIVIISWVDSPPKNVDMKQEFDTFLTIWIPIFFIAIVWTFMMEVYPPPFSVQCLMEMMWSTGLLAILFTFLNHLDQLEKGAKAMWGEIAGPVLIGIFLTCWAFIVLNYHLDRTHEVAGTTTTTPPPGSTTYSS